MKRLLNVLLLISFVMVLILGGLFYYSYKKTRKNNTELLELNSTLYQKPLQLKIGETKATTIQIIFYESNETKELKEVVLEILNSTTNQLTYIEIPNNTKINVSSKLYQKLSAIYPEMPQYFQLERLETMFDEEKRYGYGQLILDDMLEIDSSYYSKIQGSKDTFLEYKNDLIKKYQLESYEDIKTLIQQEKKEIESNLSSKERIELAKNYANVNKDSVVEERIVGRMHTDSYEINLSDFAVQFATYTSLE